tara:strand:- start:119314 stop:119622 length:309 start_codon:yes stop_codon:yes gene_type:complete
MSAFETVHESPVATPTTITTEKPSISESRSLRDTVTETMNKYFSQVDINSTTDVYEMVLSELEEPLLESTMRSTRGNQSSAAKVLGISRGTLRKKLKKYGLD